MIKVVVVSDSHGEDDPLRKVIEDNPDADYIIHCGDLVTPASKFENLIAVQGNHDWQYNSSLPLERILKIASHNVLIMHSHTLPLTIDNYKTLIAQQGRKQGCDIVLFGHVHLPSADVID
ncbi:MAG: YfcE family phosphodiesterase, partial [Erysipelotrichaceae bacterium]|nr:YfcE family phosphodiesterase [Erysipelotrichaceae bacterium]